MYKNQKCIDNILQKEKFINRPLTRNIFRKAKLFAKYY